MSDNSVPVHWRLWALCNGFWINNKDVYATNAWLAKQLKCSERMITEAVAKLEKIGVIVCARSRNSRIMKKGGVAMYFR